jgi:hypothetical protein
MTNIENLKLELNKIKETGWIKCSTKHSNKVGMKIEELLGIEENQISGPDFNGIEIKTKSIHSKPNITLFNATPDSMEMAIKDIYEKYSYPSKRDKSRKVFNVSVYATKQTVHPKRKFNLSVNRHSIRLMVSNNYNKCINRDIAWSHDMLEDKLKQKLSTLCLIKTMNKKEGDDFYFRIAKFNFYKLKSYNNFLRLINQGKIRITFKIGLFTGDYRNGEIHDRGTGFDIDRNDIDQLFDIISI